MAIEAGGTPSEIQTGDTVHFRGGMSVGYLTGEFVKSVSSTGLVTYQDSVGDETTAQLDEGGADIGVGTVDPSGGSNGDAYLQVDAANILQSTWRNASGTWIEYTVPQGGGGMQVIDLTGTPLHVAAEDDEGMIYVDHDLPAAWIVYRRRVSSVRASGDFGDFSHSQYRQEWATDELAIYNGNATQNGDGYWNTTHNVFRYWDEVPLVGDFRDLSLPHWLNDILGETGTWIWLGYSDDQQDLLDHIDAFSAPNVYVGVVNGNMVQLNNNSFIAETDSRDSWGWFDLVGQRDRVNNSPKRVDVEYNIGIGHDINDASFNPWEGNIYRVDRDGQIDGFSMWADPQVIEEYRGFMQRMVRYGDEDYRPVAVLLEADHSITTTGAGVLELSYDYGTPLEVSLGEYLWVGVTVGNTGGARGRQQADATVSDVFGVLTFEDHSKFTGTPAISDNLWHANADNYSYRQEIRGTFVSTDELVVEQNGTLVYSGDNYIDIEGDSAVVSGINKMTLTLHPQRVIVSEDDPPAAADVEDGDLTKLYIHINADGVIRSISYILKVDPHLFSLTSEQFQPVTEVYRGFRHAGNYGYLVPRRNIVIMEHATDATALLEMEFEQGVTEPFNYVDFGAGLTLYRRLKGSTGDWGHHNLVRDNTDHYNFQGPASATFFGSNARYDVILRIGQFGDGSSATVPAANRLEPYPGGLKREYIPTFDQIDSITRLYDIIRETSSDDGTVDELTLDVDASDVLTVTIGRTVGADIVATVSLPDTSSLALGTGDPEDIGTTEVGVSLAAAHADHSHGAPALVVTENLPDFFHARMDQTASSFTLDTAHINVLEMTASSIIVNRGGFAIEAGTNSRNAVHIPEDGNYTIEVSAFADHTGGTGARGRIFGEIVIMSASGAFVDALAATSTDYFRTDSSAGDLFLSMVHTVDLVANDEIEFRTFGAQAYEATFQYGGTGSEISIRRNVGTPNVTGLGGSGQRLRHHPVVSTPMSLSATDVVTTYITGTHTFHSITFTEVDPAEVQEINLIFQRHLDAERPVHITRNDFLRIGFATTPAWSNWYGDLNNIVPAYVSTGNADRNEVRADYLRSPYSLVEGTRFTGRGQIFIFFIENADGMMEEMQIYANSEGGNAVSLTRAGYCTTGRYYLGGEVLKWS